jgi:hypothetical protein
MPDCGKTTLPTAHRRATPRAIDAGQAAKQDLRK